MLLYFRNRIAQGRIPVPLRYVALGLFLTVAGIQFYPKSEDLTLTAIDAPYQSAAVYVQDDAQPVETEVADVQDSDGRGYFVPPVSKKVQAILASFSSAAGQPSQINGVAVPEPRPQVLKIVSPTSDSVVKRIDFLKSEGVVPLKTEIKAGGTLQESLMSSLDLSYEEVHQLIGSLSDMVDPKDIRPGQKITAYTVKGQTGNRLLAAEIQKDVLKTVAAVRVSQSRYAIAETEKPTVKTVRAAKATINDSLYLAANGQSVPDRLIVDLIHAYSWTIDFQRDIRENDQFEIMFEEYRTEDGELVPGQGDILYASLKIGNRPYTMFRHEMKDGRADYFEEDGSSVRKALMTTPINGARLSSGYGMRRHPVLGYNKMHKGVDFAAPSGTPIYASGDGVIEYMGRRGSYGNYIKIRHRNDLHSAYAHLKGFKKGLSNGARVRQGDVIGYVGTTGRSTGPHLHYEVMLNGAQVNPKSVKLPTGTKLTGAELKKFKSEVRNLKRYMDKYGLGQTVVASLNDNNKTN